MAVLPATTEAPAKTNEAPAASVGVVPFVRASDEHLQPSGIDQQRLLTTNAQDLGVFDIPAYGYLRWLYLLVDCPVAGAGGSAAGAADAPYTVLQNIQLTEPNGAFLVQFNNGYEMYLANKYGGYNPAVSSDPELSPVFSAINATTGNFQFLLRVPLEVSARDGLGALGNQDSAGQFKLRLTLGASTQVYSTPPATTLPTVRVRAWLSAWEQPEQSSGGVGNQQSPPAPGTTSFWSVQQHNVNAGDFTIELKRKGNFVRQWIFVLRSTTRAQGEVAATGWGAETRFLRDAFPARYYNDVVWRHKMYELTGYTGTADSAGGPENGVRFHDYMHEFTGQLGFENRDLWQPTRGSTRLELQSTFGAAGTMTIISNDVAITDNVFL